MENPLFLRTVLKNTIKKLLPFPVTQNQRYDRQTKAVIRRVCKPDSNCIDIGAHKGEVLELMMKAAFRGRHFAFEPIPHLYRGLKAKYASEDCIVSDMALSNSKGTASFNYVVSNPSYSGLIKRKYDRKDEQDEIIHVETDLLDAVIPSDLKVDFVKIDVEGGELLVLEGARQLLARCRPFVIFEHGLGASDYYGATPEQVFDLLSSCGLKVSTMKNWLSGGNELTREGFAQLYYEGEDYYFIAYPW